MDAPSLGEHGAEGEGEAGHEDPGLGGADVGEGVHRGDGGVQAQDDHAGGVGESGEDVVTWSSRGCSR